MTDALTMGRVRAIGWMLVGVGSLVVGLRLRGMDTWADSAVGLAILAGLLAGLVLEMGLLGVGRRGESVSPWMPSIATRPADGVVEVWPMAGVASVGPLDSTPWRRFVAIEPDGSIGPLPSSAVPLLGEVALVSVFVGRDGHSWTDREIIEAHKSLESVGRWLEREATERAAPVNIGLADTFFQVDDGHDEPVVVDFVPEGRDVGPMEADSMAKSMIGASRVAALLGFADVADLLAWINPRVPADAHAWLFHYKRRGRSHAIPASDRLVAGVGVAIGFARESSFPEPLIGPGRVDPTTVAHELLHLFGASDKYGVPLTDFPTHSVSRRDIMRLDETRLDRLRIGSLTAAEIGWPARPDQAPDSIPNKKPTPRSSRGVGWCWQSKKERWEGVSWIQRRSRSGQSCWPDSRHRQRDGNRRIWRAGPNATHRRKHRPPCANRETHSCRLAGTAPIGSAKQGSAARAGCRPISSAWRAPEFKSEKTFPRHSRNVPG